MGSRVAQLYQKSVGKKRKNLDARAFKALFKRQRIKEGLPDIHGMLEGPDDDKESGGDLQKSTVYLRRTDSEILGNNITVDSDYIDDVVAESSKPLGEDCLTDTRTDSSTRKSFVDSEGLPTGCSVIENTSTSKSGIVDCMVRPQLVDPEIGELTELQGTQVAASKEGHSTITASNLAESLQKDGIDAPNFMSGGSSLGAEVGTGGSEEIISLRSEQNNRQKFLRVELGWLCQILKL